MSEFDPIKSIKEEISGLVGIKTALSHRVSSTQKSMTEAETEYNALVKLQGFAESELSRKREVLRRLEMEQEK